MRVCKFGGAALRDGAGFRRAAEILRSAADRQVAVVSAPGRGVNGEEKITDLLYACQSAAVTGRGFGHLFDRIAARYRQIALELGLPAPDDALREIYGGIKGGASPAWAASRGEWLSAGLLAAYLDWPRAEAAECVRFESGGGLREAETAARLRTLPLPCVLPGFYGAEEEGVLRTFPRGGSDVTGALAAAALNADVYENWKDVRGVCAADPALVPGAAWVGEMTYRELRALSTLGGQVMAEEAVAPVRAAGVALNIRSYIEAEHPGTWVRPAFGGEKRAAAIAVTGQRERTLHRLERMDGGGILARTALSTGLPLSLLSADADSVQLLLPEGEPLPEGLRDRADTVRTQPRAAEISLVGEGLHRLDAAARFCAALSGAGVRTLALHFPSDGLFITAVVPREDYETGIRAVYAAFWEK